MSKLIILVLNWNNPSLTVKCLGSSAHLEGGPFHTIVVDNGSTDDSCSVIQREFPSVELLCLPRNLGYAGGNNYGIRHAFDQGADFILILNNDVYPDSRLVTSLMKVVEGDPSVGVVGPKMLTTDPVETVFARGSFVQWSKGSLCHRDMFQPQNRIVESRIPETVDFMVGCCVLVSRQFVEAVGYLDSDYYLNYEDVDWGIRAGRYGFKVMYVPDAVVRHDVSATLGVGSPANTYYMTRNALRFFWLNAQAHMRFVSTVRILLRTFRTVSAWSFLSKYPTDFYRRKRMANILAIRDFFRGRFGEMGIDVSRVCFPSQEGPN